MEPMRDFGSFYEATHDRLVVTLAVMVGDHDVACEAADEAFERAVARWSRVSLMDSPAGWTFRVALNAARRRHRREALEHRLLSPPDHRENPVSTTAIEIRELLSRLPSRQRAAMTLRVLGDLTEGEIGAVLGVSRSTVHSALAGARRNLAASFVETEREDHDQPARPR